MSRTLILLLVTLLAGSALAEERRARPGRRRALLGAPACEAMPPLGGPTVVINCGSQCTSTQTYTTCCERMFDLFIVGERAACCWPRPGVAGPGWWFVHLLPCWSMASNSCWSMACSGSPAQGCLWSLDGLTAPHCPPARLQTHPAATSRLRAAT